MGLQRLRLNSLLRAKIRETDRTFKSFAAARRLCSTNFVETVSERASERANSCVLRMEWKEGKGREEGDLGKGD